ncbi:hypothetical protein BpHYR1_043779 [Brachionus plicatilis]|uniref:Uncharacterized protein n=1 Tax=Brachionus plicatilis TaxID=10195 RepID=A0A3M7RKM3_BRAPC|nr:hypothetical protein BpHYR1_043779 [Brachionus plicatilis]
MSGTHKWQIDGLLKSVDKKQNEIAKLLGVSPKCVFSNKKRYQKTGSISDRDISGVNRDLIGQLMFSPELCSVMTRQILRSLMLNQHSTLSSVYQSYKTVEGQLVSGDAFPTKALMWPQHILLTQ